MGDYANAKNADMHGRENVIHVGVVWKFRGYDARAQYCEVEPFLLLLNATRRSCGQMYACSGVQPRHQTVNRMD
ncbi:hypothetical protein TNCV_455171 [Trichonephila clavipes]|nr:hypothetical protein TNCV_455171 [Trichonephila clavipes]